MNIFSYIATPWTCLKRIWKATKYLVGAKSKSIPSTTTLFTSPWGSGEFNPPWGKGIRF